MATVSVYKQLNMQSLETIQGSIDSPLSAEVWWNPGRTEPSLVVQEGAKTGLYFGSFRYLENGEFSGGRITEYSHSSDGLQYTVSGLNLSASGLESAVNAGTILALQSAALAGNDVLGGADLDDVLLGYAGNDVIYGGGGNDLLDGGAGRDLMVGGEGADDLLGGAGVDRLYGEAGDDILTGGDGRDVLLGGAGADFFIFDRKAIAANADLIKDFENGVDSIALDLDIYTKLVGDTDLSDNLVIGTRALDGNDYLVFNASTKVLSYDADGNGAGAAVAIATLVGVNTLVADVDVITF